MARTKTQQIIDDLTEEIISGRIQPGDMIPSMSELRARYDASYNVVHNAIRWLKAKDLVEGVPGKGVFVLEKPKAGKD